MERLRLISRLRKPVYRPTSPELQTFAQKVLNGEIPEIKTSENREVIFDFYGEKMRIRIRWGKGKLEKSYHATLVKETGEIKLIKEGFFNTDGHDWQETA